MIRDIVVRAPANPLVSKFSLENAIRAEVEREDAIRWALTSEERPLLKVSEKKAPLRINLAFLLP